jgi:hypothetical protein
MRRRPVSTAILFLVFAIVFSIIFWPEVSLAAKIAFFVTGVGCGVGICHSVERVSPPDKR